MKKLQQQWQQSFENSIENIERLTQITHRDSLEEIQFKKLANWMITTEYNSYSYMTNPWQNYLSDPYTTNSVLSMLHHAMVDDGEVSFVNMKLEDKTIRIFMIFVSHHEDAFISICEKENQSLMNSFIGGRKSLINVKHKMIEKYPERNLEIPSSISKQSFNFEAHTDSARFIREFEDFQVLEQQRREEVEKKLSTFRNRI